MPFEDIPKAGYDAAEKHFREKDAESLAALRLKLDEERKKQQTDSHPPNYMKCPKCAAQMKEVEMDKIKVDLCTGCGGIYFDPGELEMLVAARVGTGFFKGLKKMMGQ